MRKMQYLFAALLLLGSVGSVTAQTISGHLRVCLGGSRTTLTINTTGGTWSSGDVTKATIDPSTGVVTGVAAGTAPISYNIPPSTVFTTTVTVLGTALNMGVSVGTAPTCVGSFTTYTAVPTSGNNWASSNMAVGTINTGGTIAGLTAGTTIVSYRNGALDCYVESVQTINAIPTVTVSPTTTCAGVSQTYIGAPSGGTWASSNTGVGSIGSTTGVFIGSTAGSTNISYTGPNGCRLLTAVSVVNTPANVTGTTTVCQGSTTTLNSATAGQTWSSSNPSVATVVTADVNNGTVTGVSAGTAAISYTNATGCSRVVTVTVTGAMAPNTGSALVCMGQTTTLANATSGGAWTSGATGIATVNSGTGVVSPVSVGNANITYTTTTPASCRSVTQVTVNAALGNNGGPTSVCVGSNITLTNATSGGTWSSNNANVTVVGSTGVVTGVTAGTSVLTYAFSTGCFKTTTVTINALPAAIGGTFTLCAGASTTLTNSTGGGTWVSGTTAVGTINSTTGAFAAISGGTTLVSYRISATGCQSTQLVTVNALPAVLSGTFTVCKGSVTTLSSSPAGGAWTSSNGSVATVNSGGDVSGVNAGTANITYTLPTSCMRSATVTVNPLPAVIGGAPFVVCEGSTITLTNSTGGGTWQSGNTGVATVGSASGVVTGVAVAGGTASISYVLTATGCSVAQDVTVNPRPAAITGTLFVCEGSTTALSSATAGGTWLSSNTSVATIGTNGIVSGLVAGTSNVTYTQGGCFRAATVTVGVTPTTITGNHIVCYHQTSTLASTPTGHTWASANTAVATVNSSTGVVYGVNTGTATISYTHSNGCFATTVVTVSTGPNTGDPLVCIGETVTLSNAEPGGTWSSSNSNATVNSSTGVVSGIAVGTANITYSVIAHGCIAVTQVTVNPAMDTVIGQLNICVGTSSTLSHAIGGGTWTSSNTAIATVNLTTGAVTGVAGGTANITYTVSSGCTKVATVTVNTTIPAISGYIYLCIGGGSRQFTHPMGGGVWSSSNPAIASVTSTGVVTAVSVGNTYISYTLVPGCYTIMNVQSNLIPPAISGPNPICVGQTGSLSSMIASSASWTSSDTTVATINSGSGAITGVAPGTTTITFAYYGCFVHRVQTVNEAPSAITGTTTMCATDTMTFTASPAGGTWSSSNTSVATVNSGTGLVTAVIGGTAIISYSTASGCVNTLTLSVGNTSPAFTGDHTLCVGNSSELETTTTGGTWSSSNTSIATVSAGGVVTGVGTGVALISYTHGVSGCVRAESVTVNPAVTPNAGDDLICDGGWSDLTNPTAGGYWSSNNLYVAIVGSATGHVYAIAPGTANIYYVMSSHCYATTHLTVNTVPAAITGNSTVCQGNTSALGHPVAGGTWSSEDTTKASVDVSTGLVTGHTLGSCVVTYTVSSGCFRTITMNVVVAPSPISGSNSVCVGSFTTYTGVIGGSGTWTSSDPAVASVDTTTGVVSGVTIGTATITYTSTGSCYVTKVISVNEAPGSISGNSFICPGVVDSSFSCTPSGGTWSSSNTSAATINSSTGILTAVSAGATTITYALPSGCRSIKPVTINSAPATITGTLTACVGSTTTLASSPGGGTWSSSATSVGTISATTGVFTALSAGTSTVSYTNGSGCAASAVVTVNNLPGANTGVTTICMGSTSLLANTTSGGTWSSSNTTKATVGATTGIVTPVATGTANITYKLPGMGCQAVTAVTVSSALASITGSLNVCVGSTRTLGHPVSGGTWSSSNITVATIDTFSGVVTGITGGTITISYSVTGGCFKTATFTVRALPIISGTATVCAASTTNLTSSPTGGVWSSSDATKATINATSGVVTGVDAGTTLISYLTSGCYGTRTVTVNPRPDSVTGPTSTCVASTATLVGYPSGGSWTSSLTTRATVGLTSGVVSGVSAGTTTISYTLSTGCRRTNVFTVGTTPAVITGTTNVCVGSVSTLTSTTTGGTWSSSDAGVAVTGTAATANSTIVTGVSVGTAVVSYTALGCSRMATVNVNAAPSAIVGDTVLCVGSSTAMTTTSTGGTWSSSAATVASIGSGTGIANAVAAGTARISYKTSPTCYTVKQVTVNSSLSAITGNTSACVGYTTTLSHATTGGSWSSSNTARATVDAGTGVVTGVTNGSVVITYTLSSGCYKTVTVNVNNLPPAITGTAVVCQFGVTTLTSVTGGSGTWSSADTAVATVAATTGVVTGTGGGTTNITYTASTGCFVTRTVTVNPAPDAIMGGASACVGSVDTLSSSTSGGLWTSSNTSAAVIDTFTGVVNALSAGNATISYTLPSTGCRRTLAYTVNVIPAAISGPSMICVGNTGTLTSATAGQTWSSANTSIATVGSASSTTGTVYGVAVGSTTVSYTNTFGCSRTFSVTVNGSLPANTGGDVVCVGQTLALANSTAGGTWSSSATSKATVSSSTGIVTGVATGTANISYQIGTGCLSITTVSINAVPVAITGTTNVCVGETTTLAHEVGGGTWVSGNTSKATVDAGSGVVTGVSAGTVIITYYVNSGCYKTTTVTVKALPAAITGASSLCLGTTSTLTSGSGGTWSSSNPSVGSIGSTSGIAGGLSLGTTTITYRVTTTGCAATRTFTVYGLPAAPTVAPSSAVICSGSNALLSASSTTAGSATASSGSIYVPFPDANSTGNSTSLSVSGVPAGAVVTGFSVNYNMTHTWDGDMVVNLSAPNGNTINLVNHRGSSGDNFVNTVFSSDATTAISAGSAPFTGTFIPDGVYGVGPSAFISNVSDLASLYSTPNGSWTLSGADLAGADYGAFTSWGLTINYIVPGTTTWTPVTGLFNDAAMSSAYTTGTDNDSVYSYFTTTGTTPLARTYSVIATVNGCNSTPTSVTVTYYPTLPSISGPSAVCVGSNISLSNSLAGGTWSCSNPSVASVTSTGLVTGVNAGVASITYARTSGCFVVKTVTVNGPASAGTITGLHTALVGDVFGLSSTVSGGIWSSSNTSVATIDTTGLVTGAGAGTAVITYYMATACPGYTTHTVSIGTPAGLDFDGANDYISFAQDVSSASQFTYESWIYATEHQCWERIFDFGNGPSQTMFLSSSAFCEGYLRFCINIGEGEHVLDAPSATIPTFAWTHIAVTIDGDTAKIYVNGTLAATNTSFVYNPAMLGATVNNWIGKSQFVADNYFKGRIDEVRLWNVARTAEEIVANMHTPLSGTETGLMVYHKFDQGIAQGSNPGNSTAFASVSENHAALNNFALEGCTSNWVCGMPSFGACSVVGGEISGPETVMVGDTIVLTAGVTGGSWTSSNYEVASVSTSGVVTGESAGNAIITLYYYGECGVDYEVHNVTVLGGYSKPGAAVVSNGTFRFSVFPNPTQGSLSVESGIHGVATIYTIDGKEVGKYDIGTNRSDIVLPADMAAGVYMMRFKGDDGSTQLVRLVFKP